MLTDDLARHFAKEWIAAWNAHDLERVLAHYVDDFSLTSPMISKLVGESSGILVGKAAVRPYWKRALELFPDLHFRLIDVLVSVATICISYESISRTPAMECFEFDSAGRVIRATAYYAQPPAL